MPPPSGSLGASRSGLPRARRARCLAWRALGGPPVRALGAPGTAWGSPASGHGSALGGALGFSSLFVGVFSGAQARAREAVRTDDARDDRGSDGDRHRLTSSRDSAGSAWRGELGSRAVNCSRRRAGAQAPPARVSDGSATGRSRSRDLARRLPSRAPRPRRPVVPAGRRRLVTCRRLVYDAATTVSPEPAPRGPALAQEVATRSDRRAAPEPAAARGPESPT